MKLETKTIVITGAASGVGRALALRFAGEHPKGLVLADLPIARQPAILSVAKAPGKLTNPLGNSISVSAATPATGPFWSTAMGA